MSILKGIKMENRKNKIEELSRSLSSFCDAALIISPENRRYYTSFPATDGFLLVTKNDAVFYTDSRYTEAARNRITACRVEDSTDVFDKLASYFKDNNINKIAIEAHWVTLSLYERICKKLADFEIVSSDGLSDAITSQRRVKSDYEVSCIIEAQRIAEKGFEHILGFIKPGHTEKEVQLELDYYMLAHGAEALSFETIAVTGSNGSMPHGVPGNRVIQSGDFITLDYGATVDGYHSDMTRTVAVGKPNDKQKLIYETVLAAQSACLAVLKDGVKAKDADKAARDVIANAGFGEYFGHGTGHGVGIEIHESPTLNPRSSDILRAGHIVTDEPGIYLPGEFGVRIEDMVLITAEGYKNLTNCPKHLICL